MVAKEKFDFNGNEWDNISKEAKDLKKIKLQAQKNINCIKSTPKICF